MSGRALVLGGGGVAGIGWEAGIIRGVRERGIDLTEADLIVGTSAGSVVGSLIARGDDLEAAIARLADGGSRASGREAEGREPDVDRLAEIFGIITDPTLDSQEARARVGRLALDAQVGGGGLHRLVEDAAWPDRRLLVTAVDTADGSFVVWDRDSGVPLNLAIASSCAVPGVFRPVEINGGRYMDGGVRSGTNADLAEGSDAVVVVEPLAHVFPRHHLEREVAQLDGARIALVQPDPPTIEVFGANFLDQTLWLPAFEAGAAQAASVGDIIEAAWR